MQASADQWQAPLVCSDAPLDAPRAPSLLPLDESDGAVAGADVGSLLQRVAPIPRDAADRIRRDVLLNLQRIQWQHVNVLFPARFSSMTAHKHIICKHDPNSVVGTSVARHFAVAMRHAAAAACARQRGGGVGGAVAPTSSTQ